MQTKELCLHLEGLKGKEAIDHGLEIAHTMDNDHPLTDQETSTSPNTIKDSFRVMAVISKRIVEEVAGDLVVEVVGLEIFRVLQTAEIQPLHHSRSLSLLQSKER